MNLPPLPDIKPCPFCGSTKLNEEATGAAEISGHTYQTGWIECRDCGCTGPSVDLTDETPAQNDYQLVRAAWNRRAAIAAHVPEAGCGNIAAVPASAEDWLQCLFGATRAHPEWRMLAEAFNAGKAAAAPQAVPANTVTPLNVGRWCMSEDECRALGIDFAAYERGVSDAAEAFGRNKP